MQALRRGADDYNWSFQTSQVATRKRKFQTAERYFLKKKICSQEEWSPGREALWIYITENTVKTPDRKKKEEKREIGIKKGWKNKYKSKHRTLGNCWKKYRYRSNPIKNRKRTTKAPYALRGTRSPISFLGVQRVVPFKGTARWF